MRNQRASMRAAVVAMAASLCAMLFDAGCGSSAAESAKKPASGPSTSSVASEKRVSFSFEDLTGKPVSTETVRGRVTVIALVATYDVASQALARWVAELAKEHVPRINAVGIDLELPENRPLAEAFAATLKLPYPVCMADAETIRGEGAFAGLGQVPSVVVLDKSGVERFRHVGLLKKEELEAAVKEIEKSDR